MNHILYIDTSSQTANFMLFNEHQIIVQKNNYIQNEHAQVIHQFFQEMLQEAHLEWSQLNAICVMNGPGSYTGLRISLASAKGICYAHDIPLILINKLDLIHAQVQANGIEGNIIAIVHARENEYFASSYNTQNPILQNSELILKDNLLLKCQELNAKIFSEMNVQTPIFSECQSISIEPNIIQHTCFQQYKLKNWANLFQSEPFYMKNVHINKINKL